VDVAVRNDLQRVVEPTPQSKRETQANNRFGKVLWHAQALNELKRGAGSVQ
jgi:hypothetical protein